jgi:hypothetical protein
VGGEKRLLEFKAGTALWSRAGGVHTSQNYGPPFRVIEVEMSRWLRGTAPAPVTEPEHKLEIDEDLYATETGQVATSLKGETASTWNMKSFSDFRPSYPATSLAENISKLTRFRKLTGALNLRSRSKVQREGDQIESLVYDSEPGRYVPASLCLPAANRAKGQAILHLDPRGNAASFGEGGDARELCASGYTVLSLDLAGTGETSSEKGGYSQEWFGGENLTWMALMVGRTMVGLRMSDIVRGVDVLAERGILGHSGVAGFAKGTASVSLLHAAVVEPRLSRLVLDDPLVSWRAIAETPIHRRVFDVVVPGVLKAYDLPDLVAAIAPRPVILLNVRSPLGDVMLLSEARKQYQTVVEAYGARREAFRVELRSPSEPVHSFF